MSVIKELHDRSGKKCELCQSENNLCAYWVYPSDGSAEQSILVCEVCKTQIEETKEMQANHWRCLNDSIWSQVTAVQVVSYRLLHRMLDEVWVQNLLDILYIEDEVKSWADNAIDADKHQNVVIKDANGTVLQEGDNVTLIKDLNVKGAGFTAKRGTLVRNIHLTENPKHIEGKVNGVQLVLVSEYMKKS